jgi:hypothetical protein
MYGRQRKLAIHIPNLAGIHILLDEVWDHLTGDRFTGRSLVIRELGDYHWRIGISHAPEAIGCHFERRRFATRQEVLDLLLES